LKQQSARSAEDIFAERIKAAKMLADFLAISRDKTAIGQIRQIELF
jgi:hypothetical protein